VSLEHEVSLDPSPEQEQPKETIIPSELVVSLRFDEFEQFIKSRYSMRFVLNGKPYHLSGVVAALATAHSENKRAELNQFAALPGYIVRLCYSFSGVQKEFYWPAELVRDSANWIDVSPENTNK